MIRFVGEAARAAAGVVALESFTGLMLLEGLQNDPRGKALRVMIVRLSAESGGFSVLWNSAAVPLEIWIDRGGEIDQAERLATSLAVLLNERVAVRLGAEKTLIFFGEPR